MSAPAELSAHGSYVETDGARIFVRDEGAGDPLLLVHGLGMSGALWVHQVPAFARHFRTLAVDLRGFGRSSRPRHAGAYAIETLAADIAAVIEKLDLGRCHVLGTSMGGFVAQMLAIQHAGCCRSLVLCHTAPRMSMPPEVLARRVAALERMALADYAELVLEQALAPGAGPALRVWAADLIAGNDKRAYTQVLIEGLRDFDAGARLAAIRLPTLVITGALDQVLPPAGGRELARVIPDARHVEIEGVGHLGYAEKPAAFNEAVLAFLLDPEMHA